MQPALAAPANANARRPSTALQPIFLVTPVATFIFSSYVQVV
jgi:hypothetical protein